MTEKERILKFIDSGKHSKQEWMELCQKCHKLRVKGYHSNGGVLISTDDSGWMTPSDWKADYQLTITRNLTQEIERAMNTLPPEKIAWVVRSTGLSAMFPKPTITFLEDHPDVKKITEDETKGQVTRACELIEDLLSQFMSDEDAKRKAKAVYNQIVAVKFKG